MKIPLRTDPCPCGSGIEYSKCCYYELKHKDDFQLDFSHNLKFNGEFPVRVLCGNINSFLKEATSKMRDEILLEIETYGLKGDVVFNTEKNPAITISEIDTSKQVILYEPYCQYLWSLSYALIMIYDECLKRPMIEGRFKGNLEVNEFFHKGFYSFHYAMSLMVSA